ncbi:bifunctional nuclease family protein [Patescibacteria group bacterium]|nr:bifunctional nuclease family protein [Patescibacteria group bacterium]
MKEKNKKIKKRQIKKKTNKEKESSKRLFWASFLLIILLIANLTFSVLYFGLLKSFNFDNLNSYLNEKNKEEIPEFIGKINDTEILSLENFTEINIDFSKEGFIVLKEKENPCNGMIVAIESSQAISIQQGIESKFSFRPTSHDTIRDILDHYEIQVLMVKITEIKGGAYLGRIILTTEEKILNLDIRPSDGIAIAVRTNSPIYISNSLLNEQSTNLCV